jgi:hypothetical protein
MRDERKSRHGLRGCFFPLVELPSQHVVHLSTIPSSLFCSLSLPLWPLFLSVFSATSYGRGYR